VVHSIFTLKNGFFGLQNSAVPFGHSGIFIFFNFECYDLANGENESVKFGGHVDIEVSYKIS
jgi:hypothetical protein